MKKFLAICAGCKLTNRLKYRTVNRYLYYMQYDTNRNKYYPIELLEFPVQIAPAATLSFN